MLLGREGGYLSRLVAIAALDVENLRIDCF
jgi:hypothetical protein